MNDTSWTVEYTSPYAGMMTWQRLAKRAAIYRVEGRYDLAAPLEKRLIAYNRCVRCGRRLVAPINIARHLGPVCYERWVRALADLGLFPEAESRETLQIGGLPEVPANQAGKS